VVDFSQALANGLLLGAVLALVATGLTLIFGVMDIVNFAHGEFVMMAMYVAFFAWQLAGIDPLASVPICAAFGAALGWATFHGLIRRVLGKSPLAQIIVTFGLLVFLRGLAQFLWTPNTRNVPDPVAQNWHLQLGAVIVPGPQAVAAGGALVTTALLAWFLNHTESGVALRATGEDAKAAALLGINPRKMYALAWSIAGLTTGIAGALLMSQLSVSPTAGVEFGLLSFVVVALGGFGSVTGAAIAGVAIGVAQSVVGLYAPSYTLAAALAVYLLVMLVRPQGLLGAR
jgi:branched-chain amino acid transport system permease protein